MHTQNQTDSSARRKVAKRGFTLIEILVVIGMIGILAGVVLVAVNPLRQFAQARNTQRISNVNAISSAIAQRIADNNGIFANPNTGCNASLPEQATVIGSGSEQLDIRPCLVSAYISELPVDPTTGSNTCTDDSCNGGTNSYNTGYTVAVNNSNRVTVCAPQSLIDGVDMYCLSR